VTSRKRLKALKGHGALVTSVDFSKDGARLISGGANGTVLVWDVDKGKRVIKKTYHKGIVNAVALSPDAKWAASCCGNSLKLWKTSR
jgi:WD40 repeat protein